VAYKFLVGGVGGGGGQTESSAQLRPKLNNNVWPTYRGLFESFPIIEKWMSIG